MVGKKVNSYNYNDGNPGLTKDYNLFNVIDQEQFLLKGVPIFYYKIADIQPNYDNLYRDFISNPVYSQPIEVRSILQIDENVTHSMEVGIGQVAERNGSVGFNISYIEHALGRPPILGDVIYMRQLDQKFQIYHISKDTYRLSMPLRYLCKVRLYQDSSSVGTDWPIPQTQVNLVSDFQTPVSPTPSGYSVSSVFGRFGDVVAVSGDYNASKIPLSPITELPGDSTVQQALEGLAAAMLVTSVVLGEPLTAYTCYRIKNNKAYKVTSIDSDSPSIDGITLETGILDSLVRVGNVQGTEYTALTDYITSAFLYLSQSGQLTLTIPSSIAGDIFALIVGRTVEGTKKFILDPKMSIRLI